MLLRSFDIVPARVTIVTGQHHSREIADVIAADLTPAAHVTTYRVLDASEAVAHDVALAARRSGADLLLSVGGGTVVDVGKRVHKLYGLPHVAVPTIIANDGLISPISVLRTNGGRRESLPAAVPTGALVDLDVIQRSPRRYLTAAAGDVLSNLSASYDWQRLFSAPGADIPFNDLAYELAVGAAETLVGSRVIDFDDDAFLMKIVRAQINSGLAMSLAGTSRPCSGAEHLISHAIDHLDLGREQLHGVQVGSISLFVLSLLPACTDAAIEFATRIGLPLDWTALSPEISRQLDHIFATARRMRPDRRTILDEFTDTELLERCRHFANDVATGHQRQEQPRATDSHAA